MSSKMIKDLVKKWREVVLHPKEIFKKENKASSLSYGAKSVLLSGIISAIIIVLLGIVSPTSITRFEPLFGQDATVAIAIFTLIFIPVFSVVGWLIVSGIFYLFAKLLEGKGTFVSQSHAVALVNSAFGIVSTILSVIISLVVLSSPGASLIVQTTAGVALSIYNLYVITIALKNVHKYSTLHALITWVIPVIIFLLIVFLLGILLLSAVATSSITSFAF